MCGLIGCDLVNLVGPKTTWMNGKNIVWLKNNIQDIFLYINIEIITYLIDLS
jgi:hypothetical protein